MRERETSSSIQEINYQTVSIKNLTGTIFNYAEHLFHRFNGGRWGVLPTVNVAKTVLEGKSAAACGVSWEIEEFSISDSNPKHLRRVIMASCK